MSHILKEMLWKVWSSSTAFNLNSQRMSAVSYNESEVALHYQLPQCWSPCSVRLHKIRNFCLSFWAVSHCNPALFFFALDVHFCLVRYRGDLISISQTFFWTKENMSTDLIKKRKVHALMPFYTWHPDEAFHRFQFWWTNLTASMQLYPLWH